MCSPGKATPVRKGTQAKHETPAAKARARPQTPASKARGGLPSHTGVLTMEEAFAVANYLKKLPKGHPDRNGRRRFNELPGIPRLSLAAWEQLGNLIRV